LPHISSRVKAFSITMVTASVLGVLLYFAVGNTPPPPDGVPLHQFVGVQRVHAAIGDSLTCSTCHSEAIPFSDCVDCHAEIPLRITDQNINFIHHDSDDAPDELTCQNCHGDSGNDARFVQVPIADHDYCDNCHSAMHD